ncbi:MAG: MATE family efflux transporter [Acidimicrobiia bacterium]|nr:MATE family efflux transporter [Acidimicrobiia bacterium]
MNRHDRSILRLAVPALGAMLADPLVSLVDTAFVGRLGATPLAALGIATAILSLSFWAFIFFSYGVTPLVSHAIGEGDRPRAARIIGSALLAAAALGVVISVFLIGFAGQLTDLMGAREEVHAHATAYLRIRSLAAPAVLVILLGHGAFRGHQDTRIPLLVTIGFNSVNVILDPILIFWVGWGLQGAAIATVVAQSLGAIWFVRLMHKRLGAEFREIRWDESIRLLRAGRDVVIRSTAIAIAYTATARAAAALGSAQIAAHLVAVQILLLLSHVSDSLSVAAQTLVAGYSGARRGKELRAVSMRLLFLGFLLGGLFLLLLVLGRHVVPTWFSNDRGVLAALKGVWPILVLMQPLTVPIHVWEGVVMGATDFGFLARALVTSMVSSLVVLVPVVYLEWDLSGVSWAHMALYVGRALHLIWWSSRPESLYRELVGLRAG